jgi:hypothetical protein
MSGTGSDGRNFVRKHWRAVAIFAIAAALVFTEAVYVFLWFATNAQSSGLVPGTLGLWTMGNLINFILYTIFWGLLLVGIPVAVGAIVGWLWWKRLPYEERTGYHFGRSRSARGSGGLSFLLFVAFCIKVFIDGKWNVPIASFTLDYVVDSMVTILEWGVVILGIPAAIALAWWLSRR